MTSHHSVGMKCPYDHKPNNKAYLIDITVATRALPTRWRRKPAGIDVELHHVTIILCIAVFEQLMQLYLFTIAGWA